MSDKMREALLRHMQDAMHEMVDEGQSSWARLMGDAVAALAAQPEQSAEPEGWKLCVTPSANLDSNGIAVNRETGFVYVLHADGVNWTSAARLTGLTHDMVRSYPAPESPKVGP